MNQRVVNLTNDSARPEHTQKTAQPVSTYIISTNSISHFYATTVALKFI